MLAFGHWALFTLSISIDEHKKSLVHDFVGWRLNSVKLRSACYEVNIEFSVYHLNEFFCTFMHTQQTAFAMSENKGNF